ncbi:hypothetical protein B296_00042466, partial [Ensete ventricosum]
EQVEVAGILGNTDFSFFLPWFPAALHTYNIVKWGRGGSAVKDPRRICLRASAFDWSHLAAVFLLGGASAGLRSFHLPCSGSPSRTRVPKVEESCCLLLDCPSGGESGGSTIPGY